MTEATTTTDCNEIRRWAEERGGRPAHVKSTGGDGDAGILRIDFVDGDPEPDENLEEISWDEWCRAFRANDLALLHSSEPGNRFNKLISRETAAAR
ncbi:MAG: hypothetical protein ACJ76I_12985 [Gaiellaceae bacterium]